MAAVRIVSLPRNAAFAVALVVGLMLASGASALAAPKQPSEPFFPRSGNRGYNAKHYDVSLGYQPRSGQLTARDVVEARATSGLSKFSLDLDGLKVTSVSVNGEAAEYSRGRGKGKIGPATPIAKGGGGGGAGGGGGRGGAGRHRGLARLQQRAARQGELRHPDHRPRRGEGDVQRPARLSGEGRPAGTRVG